MTTAQLPPFNLRVIYPWMYPDAVFAAKFEDEGEYWLDAAGGPLAASSLISTTRSSGIILPNAAGAYQSLGNNTLPRTDRGLYANRQFAQSAANWNAPANETISLGTGTFTLAVWGSGSIAVAAGTATGSGFGSASEGSPVTFALSGAGTVSLTVTGSPSHVSLTNTGFAPPAPQPPGTILASDIRTVQGVRPSNGLAEPFPGWEAAGLDDGFTFLIRHEGRNRGAENRRLAGINGSSGFTRIETATTGSQFRVAGNDGTNNNSQANGNITGGAMVSAFTMLSDGSVSLARSGVGTVSSGTIPYPVEPRILSIGSTIGINQWNDWIYELQICPPLSDVELLDWVNA